MFTTPENTKDFLYRIRDKKQGDFERPKPPKPPKPPKYTAITIKRPGRIIKDNIKSVLSKKYGELDIRDIFDDIKDEDVESNISTAEAAIRANIDKGFLRKDVYSKLPNLRDGLALSYAAANKGKSRAATRAREAAYTEGDSNFPMVDTPKVTNLLYKPDMEQKPENLLHKNIGNNNFAPVKYSNKKDDQKQKEEKKDDSFWDVASTALAAASFIPGADTVTNLLSIPVDLIKGDYVSAGLDVLGMVPVVGELADAAKVARKADDIADVVNVAKKANNVNDVVKAADKAIDVAKATNTTGDFSDFSKTIHDGRQGKHLFGHNNYTEGKSVFSGTAEDAQSLINNHTGTGTKKGTNKEVVDFQKNIGKYVDPSTGKSYDTTMGTIHYSKDGAHIVPARPKKIRSE